MTLPWVLLAIWTLYALLLVLAPRGMRAVYNYHVFVSVPNVFVTLGILGTFTGIVYGLQGFDKDDVQSSLPMMIEGLKTAFFTSIYGIVGSLVFRKPIAYYVTKGVVKEPPSDEHNLMATMSSTLKEIKVQLAEQHSAQLVAQDRQLKETQEVARAIGHHSQLIINSVDSLTERMAKASSDAMLKALQEVITDFNEGFRHYMGDLVEKNFDKLTEAVDQLIAWQRAYKGDIEAIRAAYESMQIKFTELVEHGESWVETMDSVAGSGSALQSVVDEFNIAFQDNSKFRATLDRIHASTEELKQGAMHLKDLGQRFDGAALAFNRTQEHVDKWSTSAEKVAGMVADLQSTLVQLRKFDIAQIPQLEESFVKRMQQTMKSFDDLIKTYITYLENQK